MNEWLSYREAGERLGISAEAARQRAIRGHWPRMRGNDGSAQIQIPEGVEAVERTPVEQPNERPLHTPPEHPLERLVSALEDHISTLRFEIERTRAENESVRAELAAMRGDYQRLVGELLELRKASAAAPAPRPALKRSTPGPAPARASPEGTPDGYVTNLTSLDEIRRRIEAKLAARAKEEAEEDARAAREREAG